jgi:hypothetical protein
VKVNVLSDWENARAVVQTLGRPTPTGGWWPGKLNVSVEIFQPHQFGGANFSNGTRKRVSQQI